MSSKYQTSAPQKQKLNPNERHPRKYYDKNCIMMKDRKCYSIEQLYGKENENQNQK